MKRAALGAVLLLVLYVGVQIASYRAAADDTNRRVLAKTSYWRSVVNASVPVGENRKEAEIWLAKTFPEHASLGFYDQHQNRLKAMADTIEVTKPDLVCVSWTILIDIQLDADGKVASRDVTYIGTCL
ncbi:MAG: hypothetical protein M3N05_03550 [Pseudomonadota bacterium]|nr:hypothetical protein [Pseudomonadota bacterium]